MIKTTIKLSIAALAISISACSAPSGMAAKSGGSDFHAAMSAAQAENKKAKSMRHEWRDTGKMLKKAHALADKGNMAAAIKLANKAKNQAINAQAQATLQANAGPGPHM